MKKIVSILLCINCIFFQLTPSPQYEIIEKAKQSNAEYVELLFTDIFGNLKSLLLPIKGLESIMEHGEFVDGSSIKGYTSINGSDILIIPDITTASIIKEEQIVQFMCDVYVDKKTIYQSSPRSILKAVLEEAHEMGFQCLIGPEIEFYLFNNIEATPRDTQEYFDAPQDATITKFKKQLLYELQKYNIPVEKVHHEVGPSQYEISIRYADALTMADTVIKARTIIKSVAEQYDMYASFMPKPIYKKAGNGMHVHTSLLYTKDNTNAFFDNQNQHNLSDTAKQFLAGILKYIRDISAIINPTINSYKRLVPGYEAPVYICWGKKNRSALIRIPETNSIAMATRAEIRCPDSTCNPYLSFAAILKAGLEGIKNKEQLENAIEQNLYLLTSQERKEKNITVLPGSLSEALVYFANSEFILSLLGKDLMYKYYRFKSQEIYNFNTFVTDWEKNTYL